MRPGPRLPPARYRATGSGFFAALRDFQRLDLNVDFSDAR